MKFLNWWAAGAQRTRRKLGLRCRPRQAMHWVSKSKFEAGVNVVALEHIRILTSESNFGLKFLVSRFWLCHTPQKEDRRLTQSLKVDQNWSSARTAAASRDFNFPIQRSKQKKVLQVQHLFTQHSFLDWHCLSRNFVLYMDNEATQAPSPPEVNSCQWLDMLLHEKCQVPSLHGHQLIHGMDLNNGQDLFLVLATSQGKTTVLHGPLIAAQAGQENGIALLH